MTRIRTLIVARRARRDAGRRRPVERVEAAALPKLTGTVGPGFTIS